MHPAAAETVAQPQPQAETDGQPGNRRDEAVQLALHQLQPRDFGGLDRHRMVDENARQIEQPGEPAHHKNDVKRLNPKHVISSHLNLQWPNYTGSAIHAHQGRWLAAQAANSKVEI